MSGRPWKYAAELAALMNCPPQSVTAITKTAYRFVHENITDPRNFLPVALIPGARLPGSAPCCTEYSLSFFENQEKAIERLRQLHGQQPLFHKRSGGCIATVAIDAGDGEATIASKKWTHFDLFEYAEAEMSGKAGPVTRVIQDV